VITDPTILSIRVDESLYFANARALEDAIYDRIAVQPALQNVILMCNAVNAIDASALESLEAIAHRLGSAGVGFHLSEVKGPVMDALNRSDFMEHFKGRIFLSQFEAVQALSSGKDAPRSRSTADKESAGRSAPPIDAASPLGRAR
jgi:SulP family sulfate permease